MVRGVTAPSVTVAITGISRRWPTLCVDAAQIAANLTCRAQPFRMRIVQTRSTSNATDTRSSPAQTTTRTYDSFGATVIDLA